MNQTINISKYNNHEESEECLVQWIVLRENLQETIDFPIFAMGVFL